MIKPVHPEPRPESDASALARQARSGLVTMVITVLQTALIAWFGVTLTGRLDQALKERQTNLQAATAMTKLVDAMQDERSAEEYRAIVRKIAMYGADAVQPLIIMAAATGPYFEGTPIVGLKLVSVLHKDETCKALKLAVVQRDLIDPARRVAIEKLHGELKC
jgi:hypothetical protein